MIGVRSWKGLLLYQDVPDAKNFFFLLYLIVLLAIGLLQAHSKLCVSLGPDILAEIAM